MSQAHRVTVIPGDGVGPEVVRSAVRIIAAEGVTIDWEEADAGLAVFKRGEIYAKRHGKLKRSG